MREAARQWPFYGTLVSDTVALLGARLTMVAMPWFVLTTTGSATATGLVAAAEMAPLVLVKAASGPLIDRIGPRRVAIACDALSVPVIGLIPALYHLDLLPFWLLLVLVATSGALAGPGQAAKDALTPDVARAAQISLERATGLSGAIERVASLAGIGLAGALISLIGAEDALLVNAATFAVSCAIVTAATRGLGAPAPRSTETEPYLRELQSGWRYLRGDSVLLGISLMVAVTNMVDVALAQVWLPSWAHQTGHGIGAMTILLVVFSGCAVLGSLAAAALGDRVPRFATYVVAFLMVGAPRIGVLALDLPVAPIVAMMALTGLACGFINPILGAVTYERIPAELRGRVLALNSAICYGLMPLGGVLGGLSVTHLGLAPSLFIGAGIYLLSTMAPVVVPSFREFDTPPTAAPTVTDESAEPRVSSVLAPAAGPAALEPDH